MDSTPTQQQPIDPYSLSIKAKLPIKRKNPETSPTTTVCGGGGGDDNQRPPPFKFHRIWTEPDEIRFLQGLLDSAADRLSFPRDLHIFYTRFSNTMSQPYTKSQLSEKLRRLRKKFRVISARLSKGVDPTLLSPHDRALYHLSKQLWHPDFAFNSPFSAAKCGDYINNNNSNNGGFDNHRNGCSDNSSGKSCLVGVKVSFLPNLPGLDQEGLMINREDNDVRNEEDEDGMEVKLREVNVEFEEEEDEIVAAENGNGVRIKEEMAGNDDVDLDIGSEGVNCVAQLAAKTVIDVFNEALEEVRTGIIVGEGPKANGCQESGNEDKSLKTRWQEQRVAELDVFARRLRLVLNNPVAKQRVNS